LFFFSYDTHIEFDCLCSKIEQVDNIFFSNRQIDDKKIYVQTSSKLLALFSKIIFRSEHYNIIIIRIYIFLLKISIVFSKFVKMVTVYTSE